MSARMRLLVKAFQLVPDTEERLVALEMIREELEAGEAGAVVSMGLLKSVVEFLQDEGVSASCKIDGICLAAELAGRSAVDEDIILGSGAIEALIEALPTGDQPNSMLDEDSEDIVFEALGRICVWSVGLRNHCIIAGFDKCVVHLLRHTECPVANMGGISGYKALLAIDIVENSLRHGPFTGSDKIQSVFVDLMLRWVGPEFPGYAPPFLMDVMKWKSGVEFVQSSGILAGVVNVLQYPAYRDCLGKSPLLEVVRRCARPGQMGVGIFEEFPTLAHNLAMTRQPEPNYTGLKVLVESDWMTIPTEAEDLEPIFHVLDVLWESAEVKAYLKAEDMQENQAKLLARIVPKLSVGQLSDHVMSGPTFIPEITGRLESENPRVLGCSLVVLSNIFARVEKAGDVVLKEKFDTAGIRDRIAEIAADRELPYSTAEMAGKMLTKFHI